MNKIVITGLGFVTSIGNSLDEVCENMIGLKHGFVPFPELDGETTPPRWIGGLKGFDVSSTDPEDWTYPANIKIPRVQIKTMAPHVLYAHIAAHDAIADAGLTPEEVSNDRTGLYTASAGSPSISYRQIDIMNRQGVLRCSPYGVVSSTVGTINFNLGASLSIRGAGCSMASACASSAHAMGFAYDEIAMGRQDRMFVVGAEDGTREGILAFASMRALSTKKEASRASCPFDKDRSGFVGTGGATVLVLESEQVAKARGAQIYAEFAGWGQASDGHSPAISHPQGRGLIASMQNALESAGLSASEIDYVNAHATSTPVGDISEIRALKSIFGALEPGPAISSTKALTGHGLSLAGAMEAGFCAAAIAKAFTPGSANIEQFDPACEGLNILTKSLNKGPQTALSNSSGFGGANVSLIFKRWPN